MMICTYHMVHLDKLGFLYESCVGAENCGENCGERGPAAP